MRRSSLPNRAPTFTPDIQGWFSGVCSEIEPSDLFDDGWTRYEYAVHLEKLYPCMEAMRFGVQLDLPKLVTAQLQAGYGINAMIEITELVSREKRLTYPIIEASTRIKALDVLIMHKANVDIRNTKGETALSMAVSRLKQAQSTPIHRRDDGKDADLRDGMLCIEMLLRRHCKRGALSKEASVREIIRKLAVERWSRIRKLLRPLAQATNAWRELFVHVRYKPGSEGFRECKTEFEDIAHSRPPLEVVDPAEYLDGQ